MNVVDDNRLATYKALFFGGYFITATIFKQAYDYFSTLVFTLEPYQQFLIFTASIIMIIGVLWCFSSFIKFITSWFFYIFLLLLKILGFTIINLIAQNIISYYKLDEIISNMLKK